MAYKLVKASLGQAFDSFKNREVCLYAYADYWEMPGGMFIPVKTYEPGSLTPNNYKEIVKKDYINNYKECEELDQKLGYPISLMYLGYFDEKKDFVIILELKKPE